LRGSERRLSEGGLFLLPRYSQHRRIMAFGGDYVGSLAGRRIALLTPFGNGGGGCETFAEEPEYVRIPM
jgi:hypothetical protein